MKKFLLAALLALTLPFSAYAQSAVPNTVAGAVLFITDGTPCRGIVCKGNANDVNHPVYATVAGAAGALASQTTLSALYTSVGTPSDSPYAGSGAASAIAILKGLYANGGGGSGGSVTITGTLPAYAATPTFNIGTAGPLALDASIQAVIAKLTAGIPITNYPSTQAVTGTFFQSTQPVSLASLPLPTGAATSALQAAINADGGSQVHVMNFPGTQPISVASLPLPSGASTNAAQVTAQTSLSSLVTNTTGLSTAAAQTTANSSLSSIASNTALSATAAAQVTAQTSLSSLVTNTTGLSTAAAQTTANTSLATIASNTTGLASSALQTSGNTSLSSLVTSNAGILTATGTIADTAYSGTGSGTEIALLKGIFANIGSGGGGGTVNQGTAGSSAWLFALPSGASTSSLQTTANTSLATLVTNSGTNTSSLTTIASNTTTANTSLATLITNTTALATSSLQSAANGYLSNISVASGSVADSAWVSGSGSEVAILKAIANNTSVTFSGGATSANQTLQLAQETTTATGATATATSTAASAAATGTTADTAYSGTGSGTVVAILKWIGSGINSLVSYGTGDLLQSGGAASGALSSSRLTFKSASVNTGVTPGYLMLFNAAAKPANGVTTTGDSTAAGALIACIPAAANVNTSMYFGPPGVVMNTGVTVAFSSATSCGTFTSAASGNFITLETHS